MEENIGLDVLPNDAGRLMEALDGGHMVVIRSKNDFLYILDSGAEFMLFSHTPGAPGGGRKRFPKDEKYTAVIKNLASVADKTFKVEYDKALNLYGVMASAEEGILSMFPGDSRELDGDIEFVIPNE